MLEAQASWEERREALLNELRDLEPFRRGSVTERMRRCGRATCACARPEHPGHGPQVILTYKDSGTTHTVNLPSAAAVALARTQVAAHERFLDWTKRWQALQEEIAAHRLQQVLVPLQDDPEEGPRSAADEALKKKLRTGSRRRSPGRSAPS